jgi:hypothetical protein
LSIRTVIVDLESIHTPKIPDVDNSLLESLANSIIKLRGLLRLPIICQIGIDEYEMLSGGTEFYAYLQAKKFDDSLPDRIDALLVDKKNEVEVHKQLSTTESIKPGIISPADSNLIAINNLEAKLDRLFDNQDKSISTLQHTLMTKIDSALPEPLPILVAFNQVADKSIRNQILIKLASFVGNSKAVKICDQLIAAKGEDKIFTSLISLQQSLVTQDKNGKESKLIGPEKMLEIVDRWHQ